MQADTFKSSLLQPHIAQRTKDHLKGHSGRMDMVAERCGFSLSEIASIFTLSQNKYICSFCFTVYAANFICFWQLHLIFGSSNFFFRLWRASFPPSYISRSGRAALGHIGRLVKEGDSGGASAPAQDPWDLTLVLSDWALAQILRVQINDLLDMLTPLTFKI